MILRKANPGETKCMMILKDGTEFEVPIVREEEDDDMRFHRPQNPLVDGWICPYCGKRVYSMEVHPCNQPYCGIERSEWS